jgi:MarR family 2-MHQ and catechol resistance regulon transcriptional repressor
MKADEASISAAGFRSRSDFAVLEVLLHKGPLPVNTIGKKVLLTSGSITTAVQRLEKQGWVSRLPDERDRRKVTIELTPAGRERIESAFSEHAARLEEAFSPLSDEEKTMLIPLLRKLRTQQENPS